MMNFISDLFRIGMVELRHLRLNLIYVIIATMAGTLPILILKPVVEVCFYITVVPWLVSAYFLFSITRYIHMHIAGEGFEFLNETAEAVNRRLNNVPVTGHGSTGILDNPFIQIYRRVIFGIFFLQTALFLMLPLYVNYTEGGLTTGIIIAMLATIILIGSVTFFTKLFRTAVTLTVIAYSVGLLFVLIPQAGFYASKLTGKVDVKVVKPSTAKLANEIRDAEEARRIKKIDRYLQSVVAWRKKHPDEELPQKDKDALARAGLL